jgi:hypothetical protein
MKEKPPLANTVIEASMDSSNASPTEYLKRINIRTSFGV